MSLSEDLAILEEWLRRHAPVSHASLRPPASRSRVAEAVDLFGHPLHVELAELLYWHDGTTNVPDESLQIAPDFGFIGLSDALDEWQLRRGGDSGASQDHPLMSWSPNWFPIGLDWCGGVIVLDHDQSRGGYGNVFATEPEQGSRRAEGWGSVSSLVREVLESLHSGQALRDYEPVVDEGVLTWQ